MKRFLWVVALVSCAHTEPVKTEEPKPETLSPAPEQVIVADLPGLKIDVKPEDAELFIDGKNFGPVTKMSVTNGVLSLKPGVYQVSLKRDGFQTWRAEVAVGQKTELLHVELIQRPAG